MVVQQVAPSLYALRSPIRVLRVALPDKWQPGRKTTAHLSGNAGYRPRCPLHVRKAIRVACYCADVADRKTWREVLDAEVRRWSSMSSDELLSKLHDVQAYE